MRACVRAVCVHVYLRACARVLMLLCVLLVFANYVLIAFFFTQAIEEPRGAALYGPQHVLGFARYVHLRIIMITPLLLILSLVYPRVSLIRLFSSIFLIFIIYVLYFHFMGRSMYLAALGMCVCV